MPNGSPLNSSVAATSSSTGSNPSRGLLKVGINGTLTASSSAHMSTPDYDDPGVEELWCAQQRIGVVTYLRSEGVNHGRIGEWPAWHVAPHVSIWAVESCKRPDWIGWWVIAGDLPTDCISSADVEPPQHPRKALRAIAHRWLEYVKAWKEGRDYEGTCIAGPHPHQELAPLLASRAKLLIAWADDDSLWDSE